MGIIRLARAGDKPVRKCVWFVQVAAISCDCFEQTLIQPGIGLALFVVSFVLMVSQVVRLLRIEVARLCRALSQGKRGSCLCWDTYQDYN